VGGRAGGGGEGARDTGSKTRTPHKDVGKNRGKMVINGDWINGLIMVTNDFNGIGISI
jgi:hypothetical protein